MVAKPALDIFAIGFRIESLDPCSNVDVPFSQNVQDNKNEIESKEKCHHEVENFSELDHSGIGNILLSEIDQTHIQEELHALTSIIVDSNISSLERLAINCEAYENNLDRRDSDNGIIWSLVKSCDHQSKEKLFNAGEEPKIFCYCFVVCSDEVNGCCVGVISHPVRLDSLFPNFQGKQTKYDALKCQKECRKECTSGRKPTAECQIPNLSEDIDVNLNQREIKEDNEEVEPGKVIQFVDDPINA